MPRVSGLIDFYFACTDLFAYDVAVCLNAWCFEADRSFNVTKARAILRAGQEAEGELTAAVMETLTKRPTGSLARSFRTAFVDGPGRGVEAVGQTHQALGDAVVDITGQSSPLALLGRDHLFGEVLVGALAG